MGLFLFFFVGLFVCLLFVFCWVVLFCFCFLRNQHLVLYTFICQLVFSVESAATGLLVAFTLSVKNRHRFFHYTMTHVPKACPPTKLLYLSVWWWGLRWERGKGLDMSKKSK